MSIGPAGEHGLPFSALAILFMSVATLLRLRAAWRSQPQDRVRVAGLLSFFASLVTLACAIAWGRSSLGGVTTNLAGTRFVTVAVPVLCWAYFTWTIYGKRTIPTILCVVLALLLPLNAYFGYVTGQKQAAVLRMAEQDVRRGMPPADLTVKWRAALWSSDKQPEDMTARWEMLRHSRQGPYRDVPVD
jgi:hypothetical protein